MQNADTAPSEMTDTVERNNATRVAMNGILGLISSARKLDRDRGARQLAALLGTTIVDNQPDEFRQEKCRLQEFITNVLCNSTELSTATNTIPSSPSGSGSSASDSELKHGCLLACFPLLEFLSKTNEKNHSENEDSTFSGNIQQIALKLLKEESSKIVQLTAGNVLGFMCKMAGRKVYDNSRETIFGLIAENLRAPDEESFHPEDQLQSPEAGFDIHLPASLIRDKVVKDSLGWTSLEPSLKCLQLTIENLGSTFGDYADHQLMELVWSCLTHRNRMCRETGFQIVFTLIGSAPSIMKQYQQKLAEHLKDGLTDNWNQVRLAAAVAARKFLITYEKELFYSTLLPRLLLNRYYKSEAVRVYSQESWKLIVGQEGRILVEKHFPVVVDSYVLSAKSMNPAEREAACSGIAELIQKIDKTVTHPYITQLLGTLNTCAKDPTWSVRDGANLAFGNSIKYYPDESKQFLNDFYPILFETLEDTKPLMRQGAASSLASIVLALGGEAQSLVLDKIQEGLRNIEKNQETERRGNSSLDTDSPQNMSETITCKETIHIPSCGRPAAPTSDSAQIPQMLTMETLIAMKTAGGPATCPGCLISNSRQPWHLVDGCLHLIGALAEITSCKSELSPLIPSIVRATKIKSYPEHYVILETVCKIIPALAKSIGKKPFKEFLSILFDPIFCAMESPNPVTSNAGRQVIRFLAEFIGPNILRSRVELYDQRYLGLLEECHIDDVSLTTTPS